MIKAFTPESSGSVEPATALVKAGRRGLRGADLHDFLKRAAHEFLDALELLRPGETPVHMIAMGATEATGANRNGDGFKEAMLKRDGPTFVTHARAYRHHQNADPAKAYGRVVKQAYNDEMRREELLVGYFRTKEAAEIGGGLVADVEHEMLESGKQIPVSMAVKVPYDVCAACQNKAANRSEYCDDKPVRLPNGREIPACPRGGVKRAMCRVHDDGFVNHVDNPTGTFFDISRVHRPADRIAYVTGVLGKAAADVPGGAELAEALGISEPPWLAATQPAWAVKLASIGAYWSHIPVDPALDAAAPHGDAPAPPPGDPAGALRAAEEAGVLLPVGTWLDLVAGRGAKEAADAVQAALPRTLTMLAARPDSASILAGTHQADVEGACPTRAQREWAAKLARMRGLTPRETLARSTTGLLTGRTATPVKSASTGAGDEAGDGAARLAVEYAAHAAAAVLGASGGRSDAARVAAILAARAATLE